MGQHRLNPKPQTSGAQSSAIRRKLLRWYDLHHRQLPWRMTQDPYRIWVSEVMLQQTRAQAVIPYYERFLRRFPTMYSLAEADEQKLLACWSGLGYYSRARNLQKAARRIVSQHRGTFPRELKDALALPGVGTYTASAVLSIAHGIPLPVLDGNVARVISRLFALASDLRTSAGRQSLLQRAGSLLSPRRPGDFNQAMMELGATICFPKQPPCQLCPLRKNCQAFLTNQAHKYPPPRSKLRPVSRRWIAALIVNDNGQILLVRRPASAQWMKGFWELPMKETNQDSPGGEFPADGDHILEEGIRLTSLLGNVRHTITANQLDVAVYRASLERSVITPLERWVSLRQIHRFPVTTITRKALRCFQAGFDSRPSA